jgi:hypothetical protein
MNTLARERNTREILRRIKLLGPDSVRRWGRMSVHEMVCHLNDAFRIATGARLVSPLSGPLPPTLTKWIALYVPLRWPRGIVTVPEIDQAAGCGTRPGEFAADVAELEAFVKDIAARSGASWAPHPIFGQMSEAEWLRWAYLHVDHHLRQFGA